MRAIARQSWPPSNPTVSLSSTWFPELELVIGNQPPIAELAPQDAQHLFERVLRRFIGVFARPEHPLALFLDDLQWLDTATLDVLQHLLLQEEVKSLFLVGAYRDHEVGPEHPLMRRLDAIREAGVPVSEIQLAPLALSDVRALVADTLHDNDVLPLAELVHDKTAGNPLFATQFLTALADDGLIAFEPGTQRWFWDGSRIAARTFTDNVVALMIEKITRLPAPCREAMQAMACIGNTARVDALAAVLDASVSHVHAAVQSRGRRRSGGAAERGIHLPPRSNSGGLLLAHRGSRAPERTPPRGPAPFRPNAARKARRKRVRDRQSAQSRHRARQRSRRARSHRGA